MWNTLKSLEESEGGKWFLGRYLIDVQDLVALYEKYVLCLASHYSRTACSNTPLSPDHLPESTDFECGICSLFIGDGRLFNNDVRLLEKTTVRCCC